MKRRLFNLIPIGLGLASLVPAGSARAAAQLPGQLLRISPLARMEPDERAVGFHVSVRSGAFVGVPDVPFGWTTVINNDPSLLTSFAGSVRVGSAAFDREQLSALAMIVRHVPFDGLEFDVRMQVTATRDFSETRTISLFRQDMVIKEL